MKAGAIQLSTFNPQPSTSLAQRGLPREAEGLLRGIDARALRAHTRLHQVFRVRVRG
jgi:hypothetical protein